jgi:hypothetical protein
MCFVIIMAILAREIDKYIFQPSYTVSEDGRIRRRLVNMAMTDNEKESVIRSRLLSIDRDIERSTLEARIQTVVENVTSYLENLLPEKEVLQVRESLDKVVRNASLVWMQFQRIKTKYEPDFEPLQWGDDEWKPFLFPEDNLTEGFGTKGKSLITVFPRLCQVGNNKRRPLKYVIELKQFQLQSVAAEHELLMQSPHLSIKKESKNRHQTRRKTRTTKRDTNMKPPAGRLELTKRVRKLFSH